jgi:hypothetical protein
MRSQTPDKSNTSAKRSAQQSRDKDAFAGELGFESFLAMFEASTPVTSPDGAPWMVTALSGGRYAAWNEAELRGYKIFDTREAALVFVAASQPGE